MIPVLSTNHSLLAQKQNALQELPNLSNLSNTNTCEDCEWHEEEYCLLLGDNVALNPSCGRVTLWGFEGCGSMWSFYRDSALARQAAQGQELLELDIAQAFVLDNKRRIELGSNAIRFEDFLDCILPLNEGNTCPSPGCMGFQEDYECED